MWGRLYELAMLSRKILKHFITLLFIKGSQPSQFKHCGATTNGIWLYICCFRCLDCGAVNWILKKKPFSLRDSLLCWSLCRSSGYEVQAVDFSDPTRLAVFVHGLYWLTLALACWQLKYCLLLLFFLSLSFFPFLSDDPKCYFIHVLALSFRHSFFLGCKAASKKGLRM